VAITASHRPDRSILERRIGDPIVTPDAPAPARAVAVVPTYCEAENVAALLCGLRAANPDVDVLVVDDSSPDGTAALAVAVGAELGGISVLQRAGKDGLGAAYRAGFSHAIANGYEVLVQMDADLSHDPRAVPDLLAALAEGADLVIGSRYVPGGMIPNWPAHRRALSRWGNAYAGWMLQTHVHDATSGFRAIRADVLEAADFRSTRATGYSFMIEMTYRIARLGGQIAEVPITFTDRERGSSKMSLRIVGESMSLVSRWGVRDRLPGVNRIPGPGLVRPVV
jgi:dolichol-phosphate mannosyltransferase